MADKIWILWRGQCLDWTDRGKLPRGAKLTNEPPTGEGKLVDDLWEHETETEFKLRELRTRRDRLIAASDHWLMPDRGLSQEKLDAWIAYRQSLRDMTKGDVHKPKWPKEPS